jgi:membrane protein
MATASREVEASKPGVLSLVKATWSDFGRDECGTRAAALAYSTVFALTPLLILLITIAGLIWSPAEVQQAIETQFAGMIGQSGAEQIHEMISHSRESTGGGIVATVGSVAGLILGATGVFLALQDALNRAWNVKPDPKQGGVKPFIVKRLISAGMVLGLGFILAVSLALTAGLSAAGGAIGGGLPNVVMEVVNFAVSFVVLAVLFAAIFKVLPDARIPWRDVWVGGVVTALLFVIGKFVIGIYLGRSKPGDAFGAASALAVILVWTYYAGMIILLGAEFTQEWAAQHGHTIEPEAGAVRADVADAEEARKDAVQAAGADTPRAAGARAASERATPVDAGRRGGAADWLLGLPVVLLLLLRRRR